jgi:hypothetical protein
VTRVPLEPRINVTALNARVPFKQHIAGMRCHARRSAVDRKCKASAEGDAAPAKGSDHLKRRRVVIVEGKARDLRRVLLRPSSLHDECTSVPPKPA